MKEKTKDSILKLLLFGFFELFALAFMVFFLFAGDVGSTCDRWGIIAFLVFFQVYTSLFLIFESDGFFRKRRIGLWFTGFALFHFLYAVLFYFMHPQCGVVIILPALAFVIVSPLCTWCTIERRWGRLLFPLAFLGFGGMAARMYCAEPGNGIGFATFLFLLIGIVMYPAMVIDLIGETRLRRHCIARVNHLPMAPVLILAGIGFIAFLGIYFG